MSTTTCAILLSIILHYTKIIKENKGGNNKYEKFISLVWGQ